MSVAVPRAIWDDVPFRHFEADGIAVRENPEPNTKQNLPPTPDPTQSAQNDALFSLLYRDLRRMARRELRRNGPWAMGTTTLVHEAYLSMVSRHDLQFSDGEHFLAYATRAMRGLIVDRARYRGRQKREGEQSASPFDTALREKLAAPDDVIRIGELMDELQALDSGLARVVDLKFFCGFTFAEIANILGCSERTAQRHWDEARMLLLKLTSTAAPRKSRE
jgi:RNA polymerase sigma factor (TIGR02999 family)